MHITRKISLEVLAIATLMNLVIRNPGCRGWHPCNLKATGRLAMLVLLATMLSTQIAVAEEAAISTAQANDPVLHVSTDGNDANDGATAATSLKTLQAAVARMTPGTTCLIHAGTYRESLVPTVDGTPEAPLVFQAAPGEMVILSGLDQVTSWSRDDAQTYSVPLNWDLGAGNQVFRDGKPLTEARWPNRTGTDALIPEGATATTNGSEYNRLRCTAFPEGWTASALNGATVWCMAQSRWSSWTAPVALDGYDPFTRTVLVRGHNTWWVTNKHNPGKGDPAEFYISNARALLDASDEWFFDSETKRLLLWVAANDNLDNSIIEVKRRPVAVDLTNRAFIHVRGIQVVGATLDLKDSLHCLVSGITARYICHTRGGFTMNSVPDAQGISISGTGNVIRDSEIAFSAGSGVFMEGTSNALINCFIHDTDTLGSYSSCLTLRGSQQLITHNTLRDTGRDGIIIGGSAHLIQYNDMSRAGRICHDTGAIYSTGNADGTQICYNWVHDVNTHYGNGIYLDNYNSNFHIHHNVVWEILSNGIQTNRPSAYTTVSNNTVFGRISATYSPWTGQKTMFGSLLANNLISSRPTLKAGYAEVASVLHGLPDPVGGFDPVRDRSSAGIDQGVVLPGITDGYSGASPDCGAYETGQPLWRAGHDFAQSPLPSYALTSPHHRNYVANGSFTGQHGALPVGWSQSSGTPVVQKFPGFNDPPPDGRNSVHQTSLVLDGNTAEGVAQIVNGLKADTDYTFAAYVRCDETANTDVILSVRDMAGVVIGSARHSATTAATWRHVEAPFRSSANSVTIGITKNGAGTAYVDEVGLVPMAMPVPGQTNTFKTLAVSANDTDQMNVRPGEFTASSDLQETLREKVNPHLPDGIYIRMITLASPYKSPDKMASWMLPDHTANDILRRITELQPDALERFITGKQDPAMAVPVDEGAMPMTVREFLDAAIAAGSPRCIIIPKLNLKWREDFFFESARNLYDLPLKKPIRNINLDCTEDYWDSHTPEQTKAMLKRLKDIGFEVIGWNLAGGYRDGFGHVDYAAFNINTKTWQVNAKALGRLTADSRLKRRLMYIDYPGAMNAFTAAHTVDEQATIVVNEIFPKQFQDGFIFVYPIFQDDYDATRSLTSSSGPYAGKSMFDITKALIEESRCGSRNGK
jgi:hypothetical protein